MAYSRKKRGEIRDMQDAITRLDLCSTERMGGAGGSGSRPYKMTGVDLYDFDNINYKILIFDLWYCEILY